MHNITELPKMQTDIENRILQDELFYEGLVEYVKTVRNF